MSKDIKIFATDKQTFRTLRNSSKSQRSREKVPQKDSSMGKVLSSNILKVF